MVTLTLLRPARRLKFPQLRCGDERLNCKGYVTNGGTMTISADLVQDAETQILKFVRGEGVSSFALTIVRANDRWIVSTTDNESGAYCVGEGTTFADAWHARQNPMLTRGRPPLKQAS